MHPDINKDRPTTWTDDQLAAAVREKSTTVDRHQALGELVRRDASGLGAAARLLLDDSAAESELRRSAAVALGRRVDGDGQACLLRALSADDDGVVRHAAASLGRIGDKRALTALRKAEGGRSSVTRRSICFARSLITYRLGLTGERLARPSASSILKLDRDAATAIELVDVVPKSAFTESAKDLANELPGLSVATKGSVRLTCMGEHLWVVLPKDISKDGVRRVSESGAVAAAVLKLSGCPEHWYIHEYVLTHPTDDGTVEAHGVRPSGRPVHFGQASIDADNAALTLHALNVAGLPALEMTVGYSGAKGIITVREALTSNCERDDERGRLVMSREAPIQIGGSQNGR